MRPQISLGLAGEFAVLSQLALRGYIASPTLAHTKSVDILVANPTGGMWKLQVKATRKKNDTPISVRLFGPTVCHWRMNKKDETLIDPAILYCFVTFIGRLNEPRFYIVPSAVVARYVREQHAHWLGTRGGRGDSDVREFRIGLDAALSRYPIPTPTVEAYEDQWDFAAAPRDRHQLWMIP